jgi:hypothetical protein
MTTPAQPQSQYPLAHDAEGNPLTLPPEAVAWRVRRGGGRRGRPRHVFNPETGLQLDIPLTSTIDDLIDRGCNSDRYRLEAIDQDGRILPGTIAIVEVPPSDDEEVEDDKRPVVDADTIAHLRAIIAQLVTANSQTMQAMASAFGTVRPQHEAPAPIVVHQPAMAAPAPSEPGMRPDQIMQMLTTFGPMVAQALKGLGSVGGGGMVDGGLA